MRLFLFIILLFILAKVQSQSTAHTLNIGNLYYKALQGDVKIILDKLDSFPDTQLNAKQLDFKSKYNARFKTKSEDFKYKTKDTTFISIYAIYKRYWDNFLLKKQPIEIADSVFALNLSDYIFNFHNPKRIPRDSIKNNFVEYTKNLLEQRGFFVANGKTGELFDLLVWAKETSTNYKTKLPETNVNVKVIFMDSVISMGWEEYATFGRYFPGGWTATDALYCARSTYDLNSENFKVSYIKHEGQHFSDNIRFPNLSGADLEYRAKLVELIYADKTLYDLIAFFIGNTGAERSNAHGFANGCVMRDLSKLLFNKDLEADIEKWKNIGKKKINNASKLLLKKNTALLKKEGASVKDFIR